MSINAAGAVAAPAERPPLRFERRIIARIDRLLEELLLVVSPELADVVVGLDRLVPVLETVFGPFLAKLPDVEVANHVAEMVELDRPAWRVGEVDAAHRGHQFALVADIAVERLDAGFHHLAGDVEQAGILTGHGV